MTGNRFIKTEGGNYNEHIQGNYIQDDYYAAGQPVSLVEAATKIQKLLEQLEQSYSVTTTAGKMAIATEAITQIQSNPTLAPRILSALKSGSVSAFEQFLKKLRPSR
ncbi:MAG: hypothetical protein ACKO3K_01515 [Cuspidothrix sp.]